MDGYFVRNVHSAILMPAVWMMYDAFVFLTAQHQWIPSNGFGRSCNGSNACYSLSVVHRWRSVWAIKLYGWPRVGKRETKLIMLPDAVISSQSVQRKTQKKNHPKFTYTPRTSAPYVKQTRAYLSSASFIQRSSTGFIFCALFGVMSNFSNLPNMASISIGPIKAREDRKCSKSDSH